MMNARRLLIHYFRTVFEAAGLKWDSDNEAEMNQIVDMIVEEARGEVQ